MDGWTRRKYNDKDTKWKPCGLVASLHDLDPIMGPSQFYAQLITGPSFSSVLSSSRVTSVGVWDFGH